MVRCERLNVGVFMALYGRDKLTDRYVCVGG